MRISIRLAVVVIAAACGPSPEARPAHPAAGRRLESRRADLGEALPPTPGRALVRTAVAGAFIWLEPGHEELVDGDDPCCGIAYEGNRYDDAVARCAPPAPAGAEDCGEGWSGIYPGLAEDRVCGERRRCAPDARARIIAPAGTAIGADEEEAAIPVGRSIGETPFAGVAPGRDGVLAVRIGERAELVALDHGVSYTIIASTDRIESVRAEITPTRPR